MEKKVQTDDKKTVTTVATVPPSTVATKKKCLTNFYCR